MRNAEREFDCKFECKTRTKIRTQIRNRTLAPADTGDSVTIQQEEEEEMIGQLLETEPTETTEYAKEDKKLFEDFLSNQTKEERLLNIRKLRERNVEEQRRRRQERRMRRKHRGNKSRVNRNTRRSD